MSALDHADPTPERSGARLRVATWNLLYVDLQGPRLDRIATTLGHVSADLVCAQEVDERSHAELTRRLGLHDFWAPTGSESPERDFGCSLWSRWPFTSTLQIPLDPGVLRQAAAVEVATPLGKVAAISAHLTHTPAAGMAAANPPYENAQRIPSVQSRLAEIAALTAAATRFDGEHRLLCGDLNLLPDSTEYLRLIDCGWSDSWRQRPRLGVSATVVHDNPMLAPVELPHYRRAHENLPSRADNFDYTLDYQFMAPETLRADHAWTFGGADDGYPSDHLGIAVDYSLPEIKQNTGRHAV